MNLIRKVKNINSGKLAPTVSEYGEEFRPQCHFSPASNWMNDPNGLIYFNGTYHMYFQYNSFGEQWGNMSWGHATSKNLVHWAEHSPAIPMKDHMIFSGTTAVQDDKIVAAYTAFKFEEKDEQLIALSQEQYIATSYDLGYNFEESPSNPVLSIGSTEFRDPKIFYDNRTGQWNMLVARADIKQIVFYHSEDLEKWEEKSRFGPLGNISAVWECPDLFELKDEQSNISKWILTLSAGHAEDGYLGMQYFIGNYDGYTFKADDLPYPLYLDHGRDFYAGITFANLNSKTDVTMLAWTGCHLYNKDLPTYPWKGSMSLPRTLCLNSTNSGLRLGSSIKSEVIEVLSSSKIRLENKLVNSEVKTLELKSRCFWMHLHINNVNAEKAGLHILTSDSHRVSLGYCFKTNQFFFDRTKACYKLDNPLFKTIDHVTYVCEKNTVEFSLVVDHSIIETFLEGGVHTITNLVFTPEDADRIEFFSKGGSAEFSNILIRELKSIWE